MTTRVRQRMNGLTISCLLTLACIAQPSPAAPPAAPACIACQADVQRIRAAYSAEAWERLRRGEIITTNVEERSPEGNKLHTAEASGIIERAPDKVWDVVTDVESRPKYVPGNKEVRILRVEGNRIWTSQHLRVLLTNIHYGLITTLEPERGLLRFVLDREVEHDIADTRGSWQLAPLNDARETLVRYRAWVDTGRPIPGFVQAFLTRRSLPRLVEGVRQEVGRRFPR
jgi:ribosome-associated toxin RatA of RatAB toxin-antitoxin module